MSDEQLQVQAEIRVHIVFDGNSLDIGASQLDIGDQSTDQQIKQSVADHLNAPVEKLRNYLVSREPNGNITIRPEAEFGR